MHDVSAGVFVAGAGKQSQHLVVGGFVHEAMAAVPCEHPDFNAFDLRSHGDWDEFGM